MSWLICALSSWRIVASGLCICEVTSCERHCLSMSDKMASRFDEFRMESTNIGIRARTKRDGQGRSLNGDLKYQSYARCKFPEHCMLDPSPTARLSGSNVGSMTGRLARYR